MKDKLPRMIVAALALVVAAAACSSVRGTGSSPRTDEGSTAATAATADASANPNDMPVASPDPSDVSVYSIQTGPCTGHVRYSRQTGLPGGNFIRAATTPQRNWGSGCDRLSAGARCKVGFNLSYTVLTEEAYIEFQGWTGTGKEPFVTQTVGPLPYEGSGNKWPFDVTVPKTDEVLFRLVLRDGTKKAVAIGDGYVYKVDCRPPLPPSP